jgi:hypothetical protein
VLKEDLNDATQILSNILTQPLAINGLEKPTSLLEAVQEYQANPGPDSNLAKILNTFLDYPEPTRALVTELDLLIEDLKK